MIFSSEYQRLNTPGDRCNSKISVVSETRRSRVAHWDRAPAASVAESKGVSPNARRPRSELVQLCPQLRLEVVGSVGGRSVPAPVSGHSVTADFLLVSLKRQSRKRLPLTPFVDELIDAIAIGAVQLVEDRRWTNVNFRPAGRPPGKARAARSAREQEPGGGRGASSASELEGGSEGKGGARPPASVERRRAGRGRSR